MNRFLAIALVSIHLSATGAQDPSSATYAKALDLVHAYSGSGPELQQAMQLAEELSKFAPKSGYAQVLHAEAISTWKLDQKGRPFELRDRVIELSDEALKLNPKLAQAHVSKARALLRSSMYDAASMSIEAALAIDPKLSGAIFLRADSYRRLGTIAEADVWYRKFIASTSSDSRKANGYAWLAEMYRTAAKNDEKNRAEFTAKAKAAFEGSLSHEPNGAWRNVNYAIFLNEFASDFDAAEKYAQKALGMMEFPMARYHLAAARYQKLAGTSPTMSSAALREAVKGVEDSTGIPLKEAIAFRSFSPVIVDRLSKLQLRVAAI